MNVCTLDPLDTCLGCFRTRAEIGGWIRATADQQWAVLEAADSRRRGIRVPSVLR